MDAIPDYARISPTLYYKIDGLLSRVIPISSVRPNTLTLPSRSLPLYTLGRKVRWPLKTLASLNRGRAAAARRRRRPRRRRRLVPPVSRGPRARGGALSLRESQAYMLPAAPRTSPPPLGFLPRGRASRGREASLARRRTKKKEMGPDNNFITFSEELSVFATKFRR